MKICFDMHKNILTNFELIVIIYFDEYEIKIITNQLLGGIYNEYM